MERPVEGARDGVVRPKTPRGDENSMPSSAAMSMRSACRRDQNPARTEPSISGTFARSLGCRQTQNPAGTRTILLAGQCLRRLPESSDPKPRGDRGVRPKSPTLRMRPNKSSRPKTPRGRTRLGDVKPVSWPVVRPKTPRGTELGGAQVRRTQVGVAVVRPKTRERTKTGRGCRRQPPSTTENHPAGQ